MIAAAYSALLLTASTVHASIRQNPQVQTSGLGAMSRVAPGESLPVFIKLLNFGSDKRTDVFVVYEILDEHGERVQFMEDTVAVETTASFVKEVNIPRDVPPGRYTIRSSIRYTDQVVPATTQFPFDVEPKLLGVFKSNLYQYIVAMCVLALAAGTLGHLFVRRRHAHRLEVHDYREVPAKERFYFEVISDIILEMRYRLGDQALDLARHVEGLTIDSHTGRVRRIRGNPGSITAALLELYRRASGKE
jgi:hypothetical protein